MLSAFFALALYAGEDSVPTGSGDDFLPLRILGFVVAIVVVVFVCWLIRGVFKRWE